MSEPANRVTDEWVESYCHAAREPALRDVAMDLKDARAEVARLTAEVEQHRIRAEDWKRLYEKAVNETTDDLIGEVEQLKARIAELERERDTLVDDWKSHYKSAVDERVSCENRLMETAEALRISTAHNAYLKADLKTHMHLVRTMGERCDLLGGLVRRWIEHENGAVTASGTAKLIEDSERALAQGGSNVSFSVD